MLLCDLYLVVTALRVEYRVIWRAIQGFQDFVDPRKGVGILDGPIVKLAIVDTHAQLSIALPDEDNSTCSRRMKCQQLT